MLARLTFAFLLTAWAFLSATESGLAEAGHVDRGTQDLYPVCNQARADANNLMRDHQNVVFSVWVTRAEGPTRTGTATLIDDTGIFVTAGHTVHFDRSHPIRIIQKRPDGAEVFDADVLTDTSNFWSYDFVLLKAKNYRNRARSPYPLRLDESLQVRASFIGFEDSRDDPVYRELEYYRDEDGQAQFQGQLFGHSSGALVFDARGRAFALVVKHGTFTADNARELSLEQLRQEFDRRSTVTVLPLDEALPALKQHLSPSAYMHDLIDDLTRHVTADALRGHISRQATPIDLVHLIDNAFKGPIFERWSADSRLWKQLLNRINAASAQACVNSYFVGAMGELVRSQHADGDLVSSRRSDVEPAAVARPTRATKAPPFAESRNQMPARNNPALDPNRIIEGLSEGDPNKAGDLGAANLDRALRLQHRSPDLSSAHTRLALGFLRKAANHEKIKQNLHKKTRNRDYAAMVGNLALAEDLGFKLHVGGSRNEAIKAIAASSALGGSSPALQLAATYALEANDTASAAALFAQSWRLAQGTGALDEAVRRNLETSFAQAIGQPSITTATISQFDDLQLQRRPINSIWRALAARRPVNDFLGDSPFNVVAPEVIHQPPVVVAEKATPDRVEQLAKLIDSLNAELKRLSDDTKANSDKIAQTAALRSDLQDSKSSSDKTAQTMVEQIDALRSDQVKVLQDAKESNDKAAQLWQELAASQTKLVAQVGDTLKASTARSEALAQRVDAMKKDIDDVKKSIDEDRQNAYNISPGLALAAALAALVLCLFVARQLTANQLAAARKQAEAEAAAAARSQAAKMAKAKPRPIKRGRAAARISLERSAIDE